VNDGAIAKAFIDPNTQQQNFVFNPRYQSENPFQFGSVLAHETLHADLPNSATEETVLLALQTSIYLEQLAKHSKLALADTELTRRNNTNALARFNSGRGAKLGLFESNHPNEQLLPGSVVAATNWFEQFQDLPGFEDTPRKSAAEKLPGKTRKARHCRAPGAELRQGDPGLH
jgi:hypothetical protein